MKYGEKIEREEGRRNGRRVSKKISGNRQGCSYIWG
jgi:hypothetical protein